MKSINTLVEDIYGLFGTGNVLDAISTQSFGESLHKRIAEKVVHEQGGPSLRLSNLGIEPRRLWYSINRPESAEALPPEARLKFLYGDILEEMLLWLAKEAGHTVEREQETVELFGVKGHIDAVIDGVLVDVKSASSFSFNKFADGGIFQDDPFGYWSQLDAYRVAVGSSLVSSKAAWLVIDKTVGKLQLVNCPDKKVDYAKYISDTREMLSRSVPPGRGYSDIPDGKSGNRILDVACSYCDFHRTCWPGLRTFQYKGRFGVKNVHHTKVVRTPNVPEV